MMRVLVLHSDVAPGAPPDELDTLLTARAVTHALHELGHEPRLAPFVPDPAALKRLLAETATECVFNMVESVFGRGELAPIAPAMLEKLRVPFTGATAASMSATSDKPLAKRIMRAANLPTAAWSEPPGFAGLIENRKYIVKSATEDASLGLTDESVVTGRKAVLARAGACTKEFGGRWFAEEFIEGREFNVAVLEDESGPAVLPIAEMRFEDWTESQPKIVGYAAKWHEGSKEETHTVRDYRWGAKEQTLYRALCDNAKAAWNLFGLRGYARADFRVDASGNPLILDINTNPSLEPLSGFAAAAKQAGMSYADLIGRILGRAHRG
jgi:D-alanine-D-alanine ligase